MPSLFSRANAAASELSVTQDAEEGAAELSGFAAFGVPLELDGRMLGYSCE
jgi:hypothetical protein